jgi:hypothetical protein
VVTPDAGLPLCHEDNQPDWPLTGAPITIAAATRPSGGRNSQAVSAGIRLTSQHTAKRQVRREPFGRVLIPVTDLGATQGRVDLGSFDVELASQPVPEPFDAALAPPLAANLGSQDSIGPFEAA